MKIQTVQLFENAQWVDIDSNHENDVSDSY